LREETVWEFEKRRLLGEGKDAAGDGTTRRTVKSVMRQARSIFAARFLVRKTFGSVHGQLDGFRLAPLAKAPKCRYTLPSTNLIDRTWQALPGLTETDPSATVAFLLAATAGLRKGEIAAARWDWIDWERGTMHIRCEHDFTPKSGEERLVGIPADVLGRLKDMRRPGRYVLPGTDTERKELVFRRLSAWMRDLGWNRVKTVHELRKLFGAQVATQAGLYVAQRALGHASPTVTNDHYADLVNAPKLNIRTA
jgi:integrase